jgi:hypothetical protein
VNWAATGRRGIQQPVGDPREQFISARVHAKGGLSRESGGWRVGRPNTRNLRRALAFVLVVGLHGLAITLLVALRNPSPLSLPNDFVSTLILQSALPPPAATSTQAHFNAPPARAVAPPLALPLEAGASGDARTGTDWALEAQQAAAAVTYAPHSRGFGTSPAAESANPGFQPLPGHVPGEQYRTTDGGWVVWVSDHCYVVSDVPPIGLPQVLARSISTRTMCQGDAQSQSDLFKDLPAYEKLHPR